MYILLIIVLFLLVLWIWWSYFGTRSIEKPKVLSNKVLGNNIQVRKFAPVIQATVLVAGSQNEAINAWFRLLAGYIFGWNTTKQAISMTAPVSLEKTNTKISMTAPVSLQKDWKNYQVSFTMPSKYTLKTLPKPNNDAITFVTIPSRSYYVWKFSGYANEVRANKQLDVFKKILKNQKIKASGDPILNQYNDPWTMPLMRTNERWIAVE